MSKNLTKYCKNQKPYCEQRRNTPGMRIETLVVNGYIDLCLVNRDTFRFTTPIRLK